MDAGERTGTLDPQDRLDRLVERTTGLQPWRRVFHATSGVALALGPEVLGLERGPLLAIVGALLVGAALLDGVRLRVPTLNVLFFRWLSPLASPREARGPASSTWYLLSALLVHALLPGQAVPAILVLALADPAAGVVGRRWGRIGIGKGSLAGGAAFMAVASVVLLVTVGGPWAVVVALVVTAVELLPLRVDDNLSVPLVTAVMLYLLVP